MEFDYKRIMEFARKVLEIPSPSGYTNNVVNFLLDECGKREVKAYQAKNGSLVIEIPGLIDYTIGLAAHADTLGAMIKYINSDGTFLNVFLTQIATFLKNITGIGIAIGIAWSLKLDGLKLISACCSGGIAAYFSTVKIWDLSAANLANAGGFRIGDPLSIYIVVISTPFIVSV